MRNIKTDVAHDAFSIRVVIRCLLYSITTNGNQLTVQGWVANEATLNDLDSFIILLIVITKLAVTV